MNNIYRLDQDIAVIGMACRFPKAPNVDAYWSNIQAGQRCISSAQQNHGKRITAKGRIENIGGFDANFFDVLHTEAESMDPQHRIMMELVWHALEDGNIVLGSSQDPIISLYASVSPSSYINLENIRNFPPSVYYQYQIGNLPDFVATRIAYKLGFSGECLTVQTGCSSSLVAVHLATQSLLSGNCNIAIAAGCAIDLHDDGYVLEEGMIASEDGHCRVFDANATGTVPGDGAGVVVLKMLADALNDNDNIHGIIKGTATNNDGRLKVGFMAPSVTGQSEVIAVALDNAGVEADTIGYVEAHGTGTRVGDPIEVKGLTEAYRLSTLQNQFCGLGSVKAAIGHLDRAAGIAGLIKAILCVKYNQIPPAVDFKEPNPEIDFANSPFYVNTELKAFPKNLYPPRAGVSAFGIGGTNAHIIVEAPPSRSTIRLDSGEQYLVPISAKTETALNKLYQKYNQKLLKDESATIKEISNTLLYGRRELPYRRVFWARSKKELIRKFQLDDYVTSRAQGDNNCVFVFPGHGINNFPFIRELYDANQIYRDAIDDGLTILEAQSGQSYRDSLNITQLSDLPMREAQPLLLIVTNALAKYWEHLIGTPQFLIGHSMGEVTAACFAGVFTLEQAIEFATKRGKILDKYATGKMLQVFTNKKTVETILAEFSVDLSAVNGTNTFIFSGDEEAIHNLVEHFTNQEIECRLLDINNAAHSRLLDGGLDELQNLLANFQLNQPRIPIFSNVTSKVSDQAISTNNYWVKHLRSSVLFGPSIKSLITKLSNPIFLEMNSSEIFSRLIRYEANLLAQEVTAVATKQNNESPLEETIAHLWTTGLKINWERIWPLSTQKISLPLYPFEKTWYWHKNISHNKTQYDDIPQRRTHVGEWLYKPHWVENPIKQMYGGHSISNRFFLILTDTSVFSGKLIEELQKRNAKIKVVFPPKTKTHLPDTINIELVTDVIDIFSFNISQVGSPTSMLLQRLPLIRQLARAKQSIDWWLVTNNMIAVKENDEIDIRKSVLKGFEDILIQENNVGQWHTIDFHSTDTDDFVMQKLLAEMQLSYSATEVAYRHSTRYTKTYKPVFPQKTTIPLKDGGTYLITGGMGRIGLQLALAIANQVTANLVIVSRNASNKPLSTWKTNLLNEIKKQGSKIFRYDCDITQSQKLKAIYHKIIIDVGNIDGLIHAAGFTDRSKFTLWQDANLSSIQDTVAAKIDGTNNLTQLFEEQELDFALLCSSLSTEIGGMTYGSYVAANAYLNSIAYEQHRLGKTTWVSVAWDAWTNENTSSTYHHSSLDKYALNSTEGREVFYHVLTSRDPFVVISTTPISVRKQSIMATLNQTSYHEGFDSVSEYKKLNRENLVEVITNVFGKFPDDTSQSFSNLHIDSLILMQLAIQIRRIFGIDITISDILASKNIERLIRWCGYQNPVSEAMYSSIVRQKLNQKSFISSSLQKRWFLVEPYQYGYIYIPILLSGVVQTDKLEQAIYSIIDSHSALRTIYKPQDGDIYQYIEDNNFQLTIIDWLDLTEEQQNAKLDEFIRNESDYRFNLTQEVPFQARLIHLASEKSILWVYMHHILFDGWASSLFLQELDEIYGLLIKDYPIQLTEPLQYVDYALWQRQFANTPHFAKIRQYWQDHFNGSPQELRLLGDINSASPNAIGRVITRVISSIQVMELEQISAKHNTTVFNVLLSVFVLAMAKISHKTDIIIGTTLAGRSHPDTHEIIGVFVNPLPVRFNITSLYNIADVIKHVSDVMGNFHKNQLYHLDDLVNEVDPFIGYDINETFRIYILMQNYPKHSNTLGNLAYDRLNVDDQVTHHIMRDFELVIQPHKDSNQQEYLDCEFWYRVSLYSPQLVTSWINTYMEILSRLLSEREMLDLNQLNIEVLD